MIVNKAQSTQGCAQQGRERPDLRNRVYKYF
jgi:hypothetical protein